MRSHKTKKVVASVMMAAHLFTTTPIFANESQKKTQNQAVIIEKTDIEFLQECLERKDYVSFQRRYDELISRGLIKAEKIIKYAPVRGPKTRKAIAILKQNGYLLDEDKKKEVVVEKKVEPVEKEQEEKDKDKGSIQGFKDEMKRTPYDSWDEKKQLEKSLTLLEEKVDYLKLLYEGDTEYPYSYYIGERWLVEFDNAINQMEAQYNKSLNYENSQPEIDKLIKKHFPDFENFEQFLGSMLVIKNNVRYILNEIDLMQNTLRKAEPVQFNQIISESRKQINNRMNKVSERILLLDSNKMSYLHSYSLNHNLKPNYLDVLEHISNNKGFINHRKWLNEKYLKSSNFGSYNKDEVIFAFNELSLGTQYALYEHYLKNHGENNIPSSERFALQVFGLNVQGYESAASMVQYLDRINKFEPRTQIEIYRRIGAGTIFAESESDWINLNTYISTDINQALDNILRTDVVMVRDQTKDSYELKSASIGNPGAGVYRDVHQGKGGSVHVQTAFTLLENNSISNSNQVGSSSIYVSEAPDLRGDFIKNSRPKGHAQAVDDFYGRNRVETSVPTTDVQIVVSVPDFSFLNYRYVQKGTFTNLIANVEEDGHYTKNINSEMDEGSSSKNITSTYTNSLKAHLNSEGVSKYTRNEFTWDRTNSSSKSKTNISNEEEEREGSVSRSEVSDSFYFNSLNRNVFTSNLFGITILDLEGVVDTGTTPNLTLIEREKVSDEKSHLIEKTRTLSGKYEFYLDAKLFSGWNEIYSRGNFGEKGFYTERMSEGVLTKSGNEFNLFKEWDFENVFNMKEWQLHGGTQQLNPYTNSLFFSGKYSGIFTIRPENSYYLTFGKINDESVHTLFKENKTLPSNKYGERNVFNSNINYHGAGGVLGIPIGKHELGLGYVHNLTLNDKHKHLGILSYSWNERSIAALKLYHGSFNISRKFSLLNNYNYVNRKDLFDYKFQRDSKSMEGLYENTKQTTFVEATIMNNDNLNIEAFAGSGDDYKQFQAGALFNYVHDLFKLKINGVYDEGDYEDEKKSGAGNFYLSNKKETAYLLASYLGQKEFGWKTDEALRYLGKLFGIKIETKAFGSFSSNSVVDSEGRFIGAEISFADDKVVLYYFGGKDVFHEKEENYTKFNMAGLLVEFTPNFLTEGYATWLGDLGNGGFLHPIVTLNNMFGWTGLAGYSKNGKVYDFKNEKIKNDYLTFGTSFGFRKGGFSGLLLPISYTNYFNYKHIIETGFTGTYWLPGGSLGFGAGYVHNIIQNSKKDLPKNPFPFSHKNHNFNSRMFYAFMEGAGRGIWNFDQTYVRLTGKFGENEIYKLYQGIITVEMLDVWKRIYLDFSYTFQEDKGDFYNIDDKNHLKNVNKKHDVRGIIGVEFYF